MEQHLLRVSVVQAVALRQCALKGTSTSMHSAVPQLSHVAGVTLHLRHPSSHAGLAHAAHILHGLVASVHTPNLHTWPGVVHLQNERKK